MFATLFITYWGFLRLFLLLTAVFWVFFMSTSLVEQHHMLLTHYHELQSKWNEAPLYTVYLVILLVGGLYHFIDFFLVIVREGFLWSMGIDSSGKGCSTKK
ncbi:MAG TPA: hypothetical protein DD706_16100 [Nitrospiraceae bacterium]|nr:hypothetical protein [Nitrospiraceae bacterium]